MTPIYSIDINCDLGEGESAEDCVKDKQLMPFISSCNIACGGHAGNPLTISLSIVNALQIGIKVGAHPGYPDKENFGRKSVVMTSSQLEETLTQQLGSFFQIAKSEACEVHHIKLHGAMYHDVEKNQDLATDIAANLYKYHP